MSAAKNIPDDIVFETLTRLPVKSVLKFRSVSKSWSSLISSNQFTKTHLINYSRFHQRIMSNYQLISMLNDQLSSDYMLATEPLFAIDNDCLFYYLGRKSVSVMGSCDGLICIALDKKDLILWNPSTREFKKLPPFHTNKGFDKLHASGIGYDKHTNDYKVVVVSEEDPSGVMVRVYSLKTIEWKSVGKYKHIRFDYEPSVFASGKIYWVAHSEPGTTGKEGIVFFDLVTEELRELKEPDNYVKTGPCYLHLCVSEGRLYALSYHFTHVDVGIIGGCESGKESWKKLATIPLRRSSSIDRRSMLVYVRENGEILLRCGADSVAFKASDCTFNRLDTNTLPGGHGRMISYVESLVWPFV